MNTQDTVVVIEPTTTSQTQGQMVEPQVVPTTYTTSHGSQRSMLYRRPSDKMLGGVCGGLAEYAGFEPVFVRALSLLFVPIVLLGGFWLLSNIGLTGSLMRIVFGVTNLLLWPMILIGAGYLLLRSSGKEINFKEVNLKMDFSTIRNRVRSEGTKISEEMHVKEGFNSFRQNFPLKRSNRDKVAMGVCGGIAQKLGIDSNLVRLIWAAFSIGSVGTGVLLYVLLGLFLPTEGEIVASKPVNTDPVDVKIVDGTATHVM